MEDILTMKDIAALSARSLGTIKSLRSKGYLPEPDGLIGHQHVWHRRTVERWLASRPGYGHDLTEVPQGDAAAKAACQGWVTVPEIAARLGLTTQGVRDRIKRGDFPPAAGKVGNSLVWRSDTIPTR